MLYIHMKVIMGEAYQCGMSTNASIVACAMQGGSCSNIIFYNGVMKWFDSCMITSRKLHSENNLQHMCTEVSEGLHAQPKPWNC